MRAYERLVGSDGKEVMLFPLTHLAVTQGEYETYSHAGILAMDFIEFQSNHSDRLWSAPLYAPCSCKCVATIDATNNGRIFESLDKVHTPMGLQYVTFMFFHDNNPVASVGSVFTQGDVIGHTGTAGGVPDHTHFNTAFGKYAGWENVPPQGKGELVNSSHIYDTCYVNDTTILESYGYTWIIYNGGITPVDYTKKKFKWVLYARHLRDKRY